MTIRFVVLSILTLAVLVAAPIGAGAQVKDTLTVALPSHAPTLDPHMHFERVGILVNINMFDSLLHRSAKLEFEPSLALSWKARQRYDVGVQAPQGRQVPRRLHHDRRGREVLVRSGAGAGLGEKEVAPVRQRP